MQHPIYNYITEKLARCDKKDKTPCPNVSLIRRFHCITTCLRDVAHNVPRYIKDTTHYTKECYLSCKYLTCMLITHALCT